MARQSAIITNDKETGLYTYEIACDGYTLSGAADTFYAVVIMAKEDGATEILDFCE